MLDAPKLLILCWSHDEAELAFMKKSQTLAEIAPVILSASLPALLRTALKRPRAVVVLRPETDDELSQVEEFLLTIDAKSKSSTHYAIVISEKGRRFESGVQSHSEITASSEEAVVRAVTQGVGVIEARQREAYEAQAGQPATLVRAGDTGPLPQPSLLEYFKLPAFKRPVSIITDLSRDLREHLVVALGELQHAALDVGAQADSIERAAAWARKHWAAELAIVSRAELLRFNPTQAVAVETRLVPPPGSGALLATHALAARLGVPHSIQLNFCWVDELDCCLLSWGESRENSLLAQALLYTVLRMRRSEKFKEEEAA